MTTTQGEHGNVWEFKSWGKRLQYHRLHHVLCCQLYFITLTTWHISYIITIHIVHTLGIGSIRAVTEEGVDYFSMNPTITNKS